MKYLGIDYGSKYVGVAVSDDNGQMAFPLEVIKNSKNVVNDIKKIVDSKNIDIIIIGESFDQNGVENKINDEIHNFILKASEILNINFVKEKEAFTSAHARHIGKNLKQESKRIDSSAAALILQRYLDRINSKNNIHGIDSINKNIA